MSIFMKHGDVTGGVAETPRMGWADVLNVSLGIDHDASTATGSLAGAAIYDGYQVLRLADTATPQLMAMASNGMQVDQVEFVFRKADANGLDADVYTFTFEGVVIKSIHLDFEDGRYVEQMTCLFKKIDITHLPSGVGFGDVIAEY
ncbi:MAG: type VI secretion system tube protein Hcp [Pseudomonadota bacterium]